MTTTQLDTTLCINDAHLWDTLMQQARIGATSRGGVHHLTLTDLDRQGRDFLAVQAGAAGCAVRVDAIGNLFVRRPGHNNALSPVMTDSHIDMQPTSGKFDDNYGVSAGIKVVRVLNDVSIETEAPIKVAMWTDEGGSRFVPVVMGSGAFIGGFALDVILAAQDYDGVAVGEALHSISYAGSEPVGGRTADTYFEAHIRQGPVLEAHGKTTGVVTGALDQCWYDVVLISMKVYAGPTPMELHRDALLPAVELVGIASRIALEHPPHMRTTVGCLGVYPDLRSVTPGRMSMTIDFRAAGNAVLSDMDAALHEAVAELHIRSSIDVALRQVMYFPPQPFDATSVNAVCSGAWQLGLPEMDVISDAGHDAVYLVYVVLTVMIFVPCKDGISHSEVEDAHPEHFEAGVNVPLHAMLWAANHI